MKTQIEKLAQFALNANKGNAVNALASIKALAEKNIPQNAEALAPKVDVNKEDLVKILSATKKATAATLDAWQAEVEEALKPKDEAPTNLLEVETSPNAGPADLLEPPAAELVKAAPPTTGRPRDEVEDEETSPTAAKREVTQKTIAALVNWGGFKKDDSPRITPSEAITATMLVQSNGAGGYTPWIPGSPKQYSEGLLLARGHELMIELIVEDGQRPQKTLVFVPIGPKFNTKSGKKDDWRAVENFLPTLIQMGRESGSEAELKEKLYDYFRKTPRDTALAQIPQLLAAAQAAKTKLPTAPASPTSVTPIPTTVLPAQPGTDTTSEEDAVLEQIAAELDE